MDAADYAIVRRTTPSVMKQNRDAQWQAIAIGMSRSDGT